MKKVSKLKSYIEGTTAHKYYQKGKDYYNGNGVEQNFTNAVKWFIKAAELENSNAQFSLGLCYDNGYGVVKDPNLNIARMK